MRILIVDDMAAVREGLRTLLGDEADMEVIGEAGDGATALVSAAELKPDAVILDIELPGMDGYTVAQRLKASTHPPAIIFLSVHGDLHSRQHAAESGGDGFAEKGGQWSTVITEVRRVLTANQKK